MTKLPIPSKCTAWHSDLKKSIADTRILPHISVFQRKRPRFPQGVGPARLSPTALNAVSEIDEPLTRWYDNESTHLTKDWP